MLNGKDWLIRSSGWVVRVAVVVNRLFLVAVALGLLLSFAFPRQIVALLMAQTPGMDVRAEATGIRCVILLGIAMAIATEKLLTPLAQIIATTGEGDPFIRENALRLQTMGWALLVLQLLDIPGALIARFFPMLGSAASDGTFSLGGWMAVLMVFVLSRIFAAGATMRDELEGTV